MSLINQNERLQQVDTELTGYIVGTVVNVDDPLGLNRVQVRIPNLMEPSTGPVPWIAPNRTSVFGQGPGFGTYGSPAKNARVRVYFQNGDINYGLLEGDQYDKSIANPTFASPNTWGWRDPSGNEYFVDMANNIIRVTTASDTVITHQGGNMSVDVKGNLNMVVNGNVDLTATGDVNVTASGNVNVTGTTINLN